MSARPTPLHDATSASGAVFQEWNGWQLPRDYGDPAAEYTCARVGAAVYDASHIGRLKAVGADVLDLLHRLSTNAVDQLAPGEGAPTVLATDRGRILDLVVVVNRGDQVLLITSANTPPIVAEWLDRYTIMEDVVLEDITPSTAMLSVMGPTSPALVQEVAGVDAAGQPRYGSAAWDALGGHVLRRDLGHLPRFELIVPAGDGAVAWRRLVEAGARPLGQDSYQALRVVMGVPTYGRELGDSHNPLEAGLMGAISFTKGCYIGQEVIARLDTYQKVQRRLVTLQLSSSEVVPQGTSLTSGGKEVGEVTSVARVPTTGELVGLGYVRREAAEVGAQLGLGEGDAAHAVVAAFAEPLGPG